MNKKRIETILSNVPMFEGTVGMLVLGIQSVTFPNMLMAARFVDFMGLAKDCWIEDDYQGTPVTKFNEQVTVQINTKR